MMKYLALLFLISIGLVSCGDDSPEGDFPVTYTYEELIQVGYGLYEVTDNGLKEFMFKNGVEPFFSEDSVAFIIDNIDTIFPDLPGIIEISFLNKKDVKLIAYEGQVLLDTTISYSLNSDDVLVLDGESFGYWRDDEFWLEGYLLSCIKYNFNGQRYGSFEIDLNGVEDHQKNLDEIIFEENLSPGDSIMYAPLEWRYKKQ